MFNVAFGPLFPTANIILRVGVDFIWETDCKKTQPNHPLREHPSVAVVRTSRSRIFVTAVDLCTLVVVGSISSFYSGGCSLFYYFEVL